MASFEGVGAEGVDVLDDFDGLVYEYPSPGYFFAQSLVRKRLRLGLRVCFKACLRPGLSLLWVKCESPAGGRAQSLLYELIISG